MYVSYRLGDRVFWTAKTLKLAKGEAVITDGVNEARARCGNRLSPTPVEPVSPEQPPPQVFEAPEAPILVAVNHATGGAADNPAGDSCFSARDAARGHHSSDFLADYLVAGRTLRPPSTSACHGAGAGAAALLASWTGGFAGCRLPGLDSQKAPA